MYERFTDRARKVMQLANQEAMGLNECYVGTHHILLALLKEGSGVGAGLLKSFGIELTNVHADILRLVQSGPDRVVLGRLPQLPSAKKAIDNAIEEAHSLNHNHVGTEHLLLGLLWDSETVAAQVLMNQGLKLKQVRDKLSGG